MPKYKNSDIADLAHQLTLSPRRLRISQIAGAERLLELIDPDQDYPFDFVCFHITGYRPLKPSKKPVLQGKALISHLVRLIEHLSQSASIPTTAIRERFQTQDDLAQRLRVSMKTISRWRQRGLSGLRVLDEDKVSRLVFTERALQRFVSRNRELVLRGAAFRQLTEAQRQEIVERARALATDRRLKMQDVARAIAGETDRPVETIRYTLRRHDESCPQSALFGPDGQPRIPDSYAEVYQAYRQGRSIADIAQTHSLSKKAVERICTEMRAYEMLDRKLTYVYHPEFDAPDAKKCILDGVEPACDAGEAARVAAPADAPAYLRSLYDVPLLTRAQERDLFRRYNYCKYRAALLIKRLDPCGTTRKQLKSIEDLLRRSNKFQQRIIRANLRLVVSIANKHIRRTTNVFELISDGNVSLMRAVERFDYSRGFKLSTYASWAIMKNFARTIPEERERYTRYVTGREELLDTAPDRSTAAEIAGSAETEGLRAALTDGLSQLDEREREIVTCHYGLGQGGGEPTTLEKLGVRFGVTKERIRQIEKRALDKLRKLVPPSLAEHIAGP